MNPELHEPQPASPAPGIYPTDRIKGEFGYWNGTEWDKRPLASIWTRVWCQLVDYLIAMAGTIAILIFLIATGILPEGSIQTPGFETGTSRILAFFIFAIYFAIFYHLIGRSPGMVLGKIRVVPISPTQDGKPEMLTSILRGFALAFAYLIPIFWVIWLIITAVGGKRQGPHDMLAKTCVLLDSK